MNNKPVRTFTDKQLHDEYGYLMDKEHGKDTELLIDILKCTGLRVGRIGALYYTLE
jgi:hypothetical protein